MEESHGKSQEDPQHQKQDEPHRKDSLLSEEKDQENEKKLEERRREDAKSIFLENVDYKTTKQELQLIFEDCGPISRVTLVKDPYTKQPKGCAYMSFQTETGVEMALNLSGSRHRGRIVKVHRKRTNIVGMSKVNKGQRNIHLLNEMYKQLSQQGFRGRGRGRGRP